jgi:hypothetical protein
MPGDDPDRSLTPETLSPPTRCFQPARTVGHKRPVELSSAMVAWSGMTDWSLIAIGFGGHCHNHVRF